MRNTGNRLDLEILEERWLPATVRDVVGDLIITNPQGALTVTVTGTAGQVIVSDSSGSTTYSHVNVLISITGTQGNDSITFQGGAGFKGNVLINSLDGNDFISVTGPIGGSLTLLSGAGNTTTDLSGTIGGTLTYHHGSGPNLLHIVGATTVGGGASISGLGTLLRSASFTVNGNIGLSGNPTSGIPLLGTDVGNLTINGNLYLTGGRGPASFTVTGLLQIKGNLGINFILASSGLLNLNGVQPGSFIGGDLVYAGGAGSDTVLLGTNLTVGGDALLNLGSGVGTYSSAVGDQISGSLFMNMGNFNNKFTMNGLVAGDVFLTVGNGNNTVTMNTAPAGMFDFFGGNGTNTISLGTATTPWVFEVYFQFGNGTNTLTLTSADTLSGTIVNHSALSHDNLIQNGALLLDLYFQDYPTM
jgi:hypothetical protein